MLSKIATTRNCGKRALRLRMSLRVVEECGENAAILSTDHEALTARVARPRCDACVRPKRANERAVRDAIRTKRLDAAATCVRVW